ncbi:alpha/beta fold hydrolase [Microbacter margulisiae]|uniref:Pimeloyl-ACP methyl ester carboxylesterase n=1 Tax=Microbacter margulisiae TaxID=1350067 RepID=A0A7W5H2Q9_9PORP|nr:alpha/beta hydrolase [Microbacter margulisiae]MBB3187701.1 pimeloyl-ACP methyl ester carboxylesterase [Microbacter margulisiae]
MTNRSIADCTVNGINIHYTRTGGNKPTLVLLHGLTANGACWEGVSNLLEKGYDIIMPDARGHGGSDAPNHGYRYEDHAKDVTGLIHSLKLPPFVLLGHSMGGMTATVVASCKPKLLRGVILADPTFLSLNIQYEVCNSDVRNQHRQMLSKSFEELVADLKRSHPNRSLDTIERIALAKLQTSMAAFEALTPPNPDYKQLVRKIDVPGILIFGEKGVVSPDVAEELQQLNSKLQVEQIPMAGHGLHYDQPEHFAAIVGSFLRTITLDN